MQFPNEPPLYGSDAPFYVDTVPPGWDRVLTQAEADAANAAYPVPPYGPPLPVPPDPPPVVQNARFVKIDQIVPGLTTTGRVSVPALMAVDLIFVIWPIEGVLGIVDDVGTRPIRVMALDGDEIEFNFDSTGLDTTGLILLGVVYVGP